MYVIRTVFKREERFAIAFFIIWSKSNRERLKHIVTEI